MIQPMEGFRLSKAKIFREEMKEAGTTYSVILLEMKNAYIFLLSEGEERLGTLAVSLPPKPGMIGPPLSSTLLGERNAALSRMLAERLAKRLGRIVLISIFAKTMKERQVPRIFLNLLNRILEKAETENES
ncbi:hypothetical protein CW704_02860 [Candidatus Bathyarchaeota archaeon]|nr:MAG: hypothetical protein CW704_02860 [Candidatus Bathyarchaeota archaeon]